MKSNKKVMNLLIMVSSDSDPLFFSPSHFSIVGKCITVFSAPNYCDQMGNKGAFITITGDDVTPKFTSYAAVPHPPVRPMTYANQSSLFGLM